MTASFLCASQTEILPNTTMFNIWVGWSAQNTSLSFTTTTANKFNTQGMRLPRQPEAETWAIMIISCLLHA